MDLQSVFDEFADGNYAHALECHDRVPIPGDARRRAEWISVRAKLLLELGRPTEARQFMEDHIGEVSESGMAWATLAHCYRDNSEREVTAWVRACELAPTADRLVLLGVVLAKRGDESGAENAFRRALELDPKHSEALSNLAFWTYRGDDSVAESLWREAIASDPENAFALSQLGILIFSRNPLDDEARCMLNRAIELNPNDDFARVTLAQICWSRDDLDDARRHYEHLKGSVQPHIVIGTGEWLLANEEFEEAEKLYLRALARKIDPKVLWQYGILLRAAGEPRLGDEVIERAHRLAPADVRIAKDRAQPESP